MSEIEKENLIKNVVREICQECHLKGKAVSESLASFIIKAVLLHPKNGFNINNPTTKENLDKLTQLCVEKLTKNDEPSMDTIKMQIYFDENFVDRETFEKEDIAALDGQLSKKLEDIISRDVEGCKEQECLYKKIIRFIMYKSELGCMSNSDSIKEFSAALSSVMPISEIQCFLKFSKSKRAKQLMELTWIVAGVVLFNKESGKGGENIEDVGKTLNNLIPNISLLVDEKLSEVHNHATTTTTEMLEYYRATVRDLPDLMNSNAKQCLINCCQHVLYLKLMKKLVANAAKMVDKEVTSLAHVIKSIKNSVSKTVVTALRIFPQFTKLSTIWSMLMMELKYMHLIIGIFNDLHQFTQVLPGYFSLMNFCHFSLRNIPENCFDMQLKRIHDINKTDDVMILFPETTSNYWRLPLQFRGYCCWTLVNRDILLVPGNLNLGIIYYKKCCYAFTSNRAAVDFVSDPVSYLKGVAQLACSNPELIHLLELYHLFTSLLPYEQANEEQNELEQPLLKSECASQTDTHFCESNIVRTYEWNEWQMRRMAIRLANLRNKRSKSTQTKMSNMRRDIFTQVYRKKTTETQTKMDAGSNVPRPQIFLAGLRGTNPTVYNKVDLTLRDDEDYND
ncbi:hypothetical protein HELRODRAFT_91978 [Helobdella robusta]|uniref:Cilia- and flagella-associated protein 206 n=1 Tax=Helobdella robusta TaxID=6412 RepID=T1G8B2_HELRO|nr:hypothetical protein HELRODRAFT_91978 [Helobdella robusta]ESO10267.1 hypothetical protein HELRODRAFT_91978 [Helobdella robusta]